MVLSYIILEILMFLGMLLAKHSPVTGLALIARFIGNRRRRHDANSSHDASRYTSTTAIGFHRNNGAHGRQSEFAGSQVVGLPGQWCGSQWLVLPCLTAVPQPTLRRLTSELAASLWLSVFVLLPQPWQLRL